MKIGFLIYDLCAGGAERATVSLANYFVSQHHSVKIITFYKNESFYELDERVEVCSPDFEKLSNASTSQKIIGKIKRTADLRKFIQSLDLDVVIGMSFAMSWYAVYCTSLSDTRAIGTERNNPYKYKATKLNSVLRKVFYNLSDGFIFQTHASADFFRKIDEGYDTVIPNAIFNEKIYQTKVPAKRENVICGVGRLCAQKRFDLLIKAFALVEKEHSNYSLIIFGEGEDRKKLENLVAKLKLENKVYLPGATDKAYMLINRATAFVLSSDLEGMPNALMEAMAMGVPCVSTDCDMGPKELIVSGENGILTPVGDYKEIASALNDIIENPDFAKKLSENGKKILDSNSIENIGNKWLDYIEKVIRQ